MKKITGQFEVQMTPTSSDVSGSNDFARFCLDKTYKGALSGDSRGEMLSVRTAEPNSAGYVAIELVSAKLDGLHGEFALQHFGLMSADGPSLKLLVVPDSGTGELKGLSGKMEIRIEEGVHYYNFEYLINP